MTTVRTSDADDSRIAVLAAGRTGRLSRPNQAPAIARLGRFSAQLPSVPSATGSGRCRSKWLMYCGNRLPATSRLPGRLPPLPPRSLPHPDRHGAAPPRAASVAASRPNPRARPASAWSHVGAWELLEVRCATPRDRQGSGWISAQRRLSPRLAGPAARQRHHGHRGAGLTLHLGVVPGPRRPSRTQSEAAGARRRPVALAPRRLHVLLRAIPARRMLVIEPVLGGPTTTGTPQSPKRGLDLVPHHGTPPSLHRVSTGRIPMAPGLGLGPVPTDLVLVVELVLAGLTTTPPPKARPHRLDRVHTMTHPPMCCDCRTRRAECQSPI
jgi:hypothetical protein